MAEHGPASAMAERAPASATSFSCKIVTYNIAGNHKGFRLEPIAQVLRGLDADVICLQEVAAHSNTEHLTQAHALAALLRMNCCFAQTLTSKTVFGNAILSHCPLRPAKEIELPRGSLTRDDETRMPGQKERRIALALVVSPVQARPELDFICICTHFGLYNTRESQPAEEKSPCLEPVRQIDAFVTQANRRQTPAILAGDLNVERGSTIMNSLAHNWNLHETGNTFKTKKIDWILDRGGGVWRMRSQIALTFDASDHFPIVAEWEAVGTRAQMERVHDEVDKVDIMNCDGDTEVTHDDCGGKGNGKGARKGTRKGGKGGKGGRGGKGKGTCSAFKKGNCNRGESCWYKHVEA
jgi:endonuclease/exonuclease/phosphatase family metal-dependent hydrolase